MAGLLLSSAALVLNLKARVDVGDTYRARRPRPPAPGRPYSPQVALGLRKKHSSLGRRFFQNGQSCLPPVSMTWA